MCPQRGEDDELRDYEADAKRRRHRDLHDVVPFALATPGQPIAYSCDVCERLWFLRGETPAQSTYVKTKDGCLDTKGVMQSLGTKLSELRSEHSKRE
ncbi:hypothetical protein HPB47_014021 [Ixodes persulcatus]|uniref:Uncharacterized protein n=1 Tax=Ixodes persulcatus TaxID=34615 RepID=A0AC60QYW6_IXOPE|nr:hypothetical protein HPB47_014021 [Ixodes persulcatus]